MIADEVNNRPMSILDYRTSTEAWTDELLKLTQSTPVLHLLNRQRAARRNRELVINLSGRLRTFINMA
jgi:hypothetical protein